MDEDVVPMDEDVVPLVLYTSVTLLHMIFLLYMCLRTPQFCPNMFSHIRERVLRGSCFRRSVKHIDKQQLLVQERLDDIHVESILGFVQVCVLLLGTLAALATIRIVAGLPRHGNDLDAAFFTCSYMAQAALLWCPQVVNRKTLGPVFFLLEASVMWYAGYHVYTDPKLFEYYYTLFLVFRFTLSIAYPVPVCFMCTNAVWAVLSIYGRLRVDTTDGIPQNHIILNEVSILIIQSYLAWQYGTLQKKQVCSDLKASGFLKSKKVMERLLSEMCDAVVELDSNFEIQEACPKLAALLLRDDTGRALQGDRFENLTFSEEDRDHFNEFVTNRATPMTHEQNILDNEQASSTYLSLRDAYGTPVAVQLFHSCHRAPPDEVCHIVGVHEVEREEEGGDVVTDMFVGQASDADEPRAARDQTRLREGPSDETASIASSVSSGTAVTSVGGTFALAPLIRERDMLAPISLLFSGLSMEVFACTMGMMSLTGPMVYGGSLSEYILDYSSFHDWARNTVNGLLNEDGDADVQPSKFHIRVTSPAYRQHAKLEFHADAYIIDCQEEARLSEMGVEMPEDWGDDERAMLCVLELRNPEPRWRRRKRSKSHVRRIVVTQHDPLETLMSL